MSPSRGPSSPHPLSITSSTPNNDIPTETKANIASSNALTHLKHNIHYLFAPDSPSAPHPAHLRTRALLRTLRYISIFIFWRVVRYAKIVAIGSLVAAVGATAFGSVLTGVGAIVAPTTLVGSLGMGLVWWVGKWGFRKTGVGRRYEVAVAEERGREEEGEEGEVRRDGQWRDVQGPNVVPW